MSRLSGWLTVKSHMSHNKTTVMPNFPICHWSKESGQWFHFEVGVGLKVTIGERVGFTKRHCEMYSKVHLSSVLGSDTNYHTSDVVIEAIGSLRRVEAKAAVK